ncbi:MULTISPECIES: phytoene desaturase family protein [Streptomyces]|uniref:Pyridine nucleotide-disulfide oxidoreductase domain-containing protein 2 n=1 Tax=Streptomyces tsukubensis (strain DSM 42081 / NBRC 108919 / NRRL 18488 / 9993) TaxID=1114943 RepID=I2NBH2_STRT9|nr:MULTISPECIES: NAD(P)/FAD-dependent oxidoreductase [Streptomyces]AZK98099.1 FAD-dependent oxidoreductase [Streptomyces tsukubensis]EIF94369.1 amine oxidase [Streptomyces tsukubensis NRRL18488]MYS68058.1 FAD-dependent oxidoreductase [Streptomyces sp. SID5473]QKM65979.1 NAD(P)/FAD-dependent oxidoreductase [Streptomyces tsukubensis NRRL18488]TAI42263.1 NAD(P)/FAD-dependent oxidoreductase [Streptomyces tsukubensis]
MPAQTSYDAVIVGGGHNGLVAAAYLARAGRSVLLLERAPVTGGAAVSTRPFAGVDARLSRYSYLVSLLPDTIVRDLGLAFAVRKRTVSSYTPYGTGGLLVAAGRTRDSFAALTGGDREYEAWNAFYGMTGRVAARVFPTLTEPLPTREELRARIDDDTAWRTLFEEPVGVAVEERFRHDLVRGVVLTDALIGTFADAHDPGLVQNRCFLYHVIGGGTGDWDVPVGGMGALTDALAAAARSAGAELLTGHEVTRIDTDGTTAGIGWTADGRDGTVAARHVLVNAAPRELARLLGEEPPGPAPEGAQFKVNMLLRRLPALKDASVDPRRAFAGTFHISEGYEQLATAYREASAGRLPSAPPSEIYCHSLTDPSILGPGLAADGHHTLTLFGLHTPARLFAGDNDRTRTELLARTLTELDSHLAEPLADCLAVDADGAPCIEAKTPLDVEREVGMPGGHIFHRDLAFPYATEETGRWGVETGHANVLLCGAGAVRGGGVSGIPGHNAAMAALGR